MGVLTDLKACVVTNTDVTLGLATGVNIVDQISAIEVKAQEMSLMIADLRSLTLQGTLDTALGTCATDLA